MAQPAEGLRGKTPRSKRQTTTASTALKKITEAVDQINALTRRSIARDALWDVTKYTLEALRDKFDSGIWLLRAIWYAEPIQLVTIGKWMSRIDRETTDELNALNAHIRARDEYETTDDEYEEIYRQRDDTPPQRHRTKYANTAPNKTLPLHDKYRSNATGNTPRPGDCWPPTGECQSCGFQPQQRAGNRCIVLARVCNSCGMTGHMEKTCRKTPELEPVQTAEHTDTNVPTNEDTETKPPDDQPPNASPHEVTNIFQDTAPAGNGKRCDTGPAESENHKPQREQREPHGHTITQNETQLDTQHSHAITQNEVQLATVTGKDDTALKTNDGANNSKQNLTPRPEPGMNHDKIRAYLWMRLSEAVNALRSNSTHELSATELSLAERIGIGDDDNTTAPTREKHFRNAYHHKKQTVS